MGKHEGRSDRQRWADGAGGWLRQVRRTFTAALSVLRAHPGLSVFPVLSLLAAAAIAGGTIWASGEFGQHGPAKYVSAAALAILPVAVVFVLTLGDTALLYAADQLLRAGAADTHQVIQIVLSRWRALARCFLAEGALRAFALGACVVGLTEKLMGVGDVAMAGFWLVSSFTSARAKVSYLLPPVIVLEGRGYGDGKERVDALHGQTWGPKSASVSTGISLVSTVLAGPVVAAALGYLAVSGRAASLGNPALVAVLAWGTLIWVLTGAVRAIYQVAMYRYAADSVAISPFDSSDLVRIFHRAD